MRERQFSQWKMVKGCGTWRRSPREADRRPPAWTRRGCCGEMRAGGSVCGWAWSVLPHSRVQVHCSPGRFGRGQTLRTAGPLPPLARPR